MAFGKQQEIEDLQGQVVNLAEQNTSLHTENGELRYKLAMAQAAGKLMPRIEEAIEGFYDDPLIIEVAADQAEAQVITEERQRIQGGLAKGLIEQHGEKWATNYQLEHGPEIKQELDELFAADGTYLRAEAEAAAAVRAEIKATLIEEHQAEIRAELTTPEAKEAFKDRIREEVTGSADAIKFRRDTQDDLETTWRAETETEALEQIRAEEAAKEDEFKTAYKELYLKSQLGQRHRKEIRDEHEGTWRNASLEAIAKQLSDEELRGLLEITAQQARERLARETYATELVGAFESTGIDTSAIVKNSKLEIYLGTINKVKKNSNDYGYGSTPQTTETQLSCPRKITLVALGEGRFKVDEDTLLAAKSAYERDNGLEYGTIITIGRKITENGETRLDSFIAADVPLHYDHDATDAEITDGFLPVANVSVNGVPARHIDDVKMV